MSQIRVPFLRLIVLDPNSKRLPGAHHHDQFPRSVDDIFHNGYQVLLSLDPGYGEPVLFVDIGYSFNLSLKIDEHPSWPAFLTI